MPKTPKVNPVHFKPTWFFIRMPDEADEIQKAFNPCLALSDVDMIAIRIALSTFTNYINESTEGIDQRMLNISSKIEEINTKLKTVIDIEFEDVD